MEIKNLVVQFYESAGILNESYLQDILHPDVTLEWYSTKGLLTLDQSDIMALSKDLRESYFSLRAEVQEVLKEGDSVVIRYTYFVRTFENQEEELILAVFFTSWKIKECKLFKGCQMSQLIG